jgi:D-alanyl-D-alanine carboxypeptidase/D-alanyl-D-alanine-endopeptidase (penicillin-binding protein 4)
MGASVDPSRLTPESLEDLALAYAPSARTRLPLAIAAALLMLSALLAAPAAAAEIVTLGASSSLMTYGDTVRLTGQASGDPSCLANRPVELAWRSVDSDAWAVVADGVTSPDGTFSLVNGQDHSGRFRAQLPATASCAAAASDGVAVRVRAFVDTSLLAGSLDVGSCVDVDVTVSPAKPGQTVELQRRTGGAWTAIAMLTLDDVSTATTSPCFGWADVGMVRLRIRWSPQDDLNAPGVGIPLAFEITEAPWMEAIDDAVGGRAVSVGVADAGETMFERADAVPRTPASNEKLLLSMALLDRFGPDHRIPTFAAAAHVGTAGVVRGNLWILGRGDPEIRPARLGALARQLDEAGVSRVRGRVMGATTYFRHDWFAPGWKRGITRRYVALPTALTFDRNVANGRRIRDPEIRAAASLTDRLERRGIRVTGRPGAGVPPGGVSPVARIRSRPLFALLRAMDRPSDNWYAEVLGKMLAAERSGPPGTIAKAATSIEAFTDAHGADFRLFDSSGLSYDNRVTARGILALLAFAGTADWGDDLRRALPRGGQGTLETRLHDVRLRAKTGTLDGISALSGWVFLEREQRWVEFSILSAGMSKDAAVRIEDKVVHVLSSRATI